MIAVALATAGWFGYEAVTAFARNRWDFLTRVFSGYPLGLIAQSLIALIAQYFIPWGWAHLLSVLSVMLSVAVCLHVLNRRSRPSLVIAIPLLDLLFLVAVMSFSIFRLSKIYFEDGVYTRGAAYSDFSFHTQLISSFAIGRNLNRSSLFGFETIMSAGSPLAYPVLVNFHAAFLLIDCDVSYPRAMKYSAFIVAVCFIFQIYALTMHFTDGDSAASLLAIPLWVFTGGTGAYESFDVRPPHRSDNYDYIHIFLRGQRVFWFQSLTHIFHPQRSATFAMPLCYIAINALLSGVERFDWRFFALAALIVGVCPQTQVHAYVALAVFSLAFAALTFPLTARWLRPCKCWILYGILANAVAFPLCAPFFSRTRNSDSFFQIKPVWLNPTFVRQRRQSETAAFCELWWPALGPFAVISLASGFATSNAKQVRAYAAALAVFALSSVVMFQPWELDNCKVFQDGWVPLAVGVVAQYFTRLWRSTRRIWMRLALIVLFVGTIASGCANVFTYENGRGALYSQADAAVGQWVAENSPVDAVFHAPQDEVMIPPACYAGRRLLIGYGGWILSHGLINSSREQMGNDWYAGKYPWQARDVGVGYLFTVDRTRGKSNNIEKTEWWEKVMESGEYRVFRLREVAPKKNSHRP